MKTKDKSLNKTNSMEVSASITIYLALCMLLIMILLCTVIESARVNAINAKIRGATYMGLDSTFSEYALPVFEDYGVMMLWCKDDEFIRRFGDYVDKNMKTGDASIIRATDLYKIEYSNATLNNVKRPTDGDGMMFADQVYDYMKYYLVEEAVDEMLDEVDIIGDGKKINNFMDKIKKHKKTFVAVEKSVEKVKKKVDKIRSMEDAPFKYLNDLKSSLEDYSENGGDEMPGDIRRYENELKKSQNEINSSLDDIDKEIEKYHENVQKADAAVKEIEAYIDSDKEGMSARVYENLLAEVDEIKIKSGEFSADHYAVEENQRKIDENKEKLASLDDMFNIIDSGVDEDNAKEVSDAVSGYCDLFSDFDLSGLEIKYDKEKIPKEDSGFLDEIEKIFSKGIMAYIAPEVSDKSVSLKDIPSDGHKGGGSSGDGLLEEAKNKILFAEYIKGHFGRYTEPMEEHALDYEAEYILSGKKSDKENLNSVVNELVALRTGCNLISIIGDSEKKAEALALATALVGFTGMPVIIKLMQMIILGAWSQAEAFVDVKQLFEGGKVVTIKKSDEWNLSLSAVKEFAADKINGGKSSKKGYSYEDYLRLLLLAHNKTVQILRTMDVIQFNMIKNENADFRISNCIMEASIQAEYRAAPLFVNFLFVKKNVGSQDGKYEFSLLQGYAY